MCPELETARLNRRRALSIGSPSPTLTLMLTSKEVIGRAQVLSVCMYVGVVEEWCRENKRALRQYSSFKNQGLQKWSWNNENCR